MKGVKTKMNYTIRILKKELDRLNELIPQTIESRRSKEFRVAEIELAIGILKEEQKEFNEHLES